jgi:molecular chaperone HscC
MEAELWSVDRGPGPTGIHDRANVILEVETTVVSTGNKAALVVERTPGRMSKAEVEAARRTMARLKFHPREALPNVTALARADALFVELSGPQRAMLASAIGAFRATLEGQREPEIIAAREQLLSLVLSFRKNE